MNNLELRSALAVRIRSFRNVSITNDPNRGYRKLANDCRKGKISYNRIFGMAKVSK